MIFQWKWECCVYLFLRNEDLQRSIIYKIYKICLFTFYRFILITQLSRNQQIMKKLILFEVCSWTRKKLKILVISLTFMLGGNKLISLTFMLGCKQLLMIMTTILSRWYFLVFLSNYFKIFGRIDWETLIFLTYLRVEYCLLRCKFFCQKCLN